MTSVLLPYLGSAKFWNAAVQYVSVWNIYLSNDIFSFLNVILRQIQMQSLDFTPNHVPCHFL